MQLYKLLFLHRSIISSLRVYHQNPDTSYKTPHNRNDDVQ